MAAKTTTVTLGALAHYAKEQVEKGNYGNVSEVVRDALRLHEERNLKLQALREEVNKGMADLEAGRITRSTPGDVERKAMAIKER